MKRPSRNTAMALICLTAVFTMMGAAYAAVPLYNIFCRVTGFGGTTQVASSGPTEVLDREVTVRFDASVAGAPLRFEAEQTTMRVRLGERALAYYTVTNLADRPVTSIASYNVTPFKAGPYFQKLECFCFTEQVFQPGESVELAVLFFVDPSMNSERRMEDVGEITLSYSFFEKPGAGGDVAARAAEGTTGG